MGDKAGEKNLQKKEKSTRMFGKYYITIKSAGPYHTNPKVIRELGSWSTKAL